MYGVHVGLIRYFNYCFEGKRSLALPLPPPYPPHPQSNSPHLIDQYSNMAPRLSEQTTIFSGSLSTYLFLCSCAVIYVTHT